MKNLPDLHGCKSPLKITFEDGRVWEDVQLDYVYYARANPQPDEEPEEDDIGVTYQGLEYSIVASRIKKIEFKKKD
ncbi:hypothetical protein [Helicobacter vulpis]|uniref:hypothetical protein n=1 Tax=Helicobacter vulpis TaxID=2316076 RepID=UPI000EB38675|nr:hypothetical protein [Helicobacter vulpis]